MEFYDLHLVSAVWYARHALAVDENRKDFARVQWGGRGNSGPKRPEAYPDWLQQIWFSGNHSDIGGSYPENESRLSDIALSWMVQAAVNLPDADSPTGNGIKVDTRYLKLNPGRDMRGEVLNVSLFEKIFDFRALTSRAPFVLRDLPNLG